MGGLLRRTMAAILNAMALMVALLVSGPPAQADALPDPWPCTGTNGKITCLSFSGYDGTSTWGYPVSNLHNCTNYAAFRLAQNGAENRLFAF